MEFEDEHDEEHEEEEDEDEEDITIPPPPPPPPSMVPPPSYESLLGANHNSTPVTRPRVINSDRVIRSGVVRYRECLKNHAVNIGGHALDGCGEFMPAGDEGTLDALKCAACNCHRNFHRKEVDTAAAAVDPPPAALYPQFSAYYRTPAPPLPSGYLHMTASAAPHHHHLHRPLVVVPSTSGGTHSGEMADDMSHPSSSGGGGGGGGGGSSKKRFRTKFTVEQKEKMMSFAEKLGWRIQKHDEMAVQQFCDELQIKRQVLKVWMHNNKHTHGKTQP